MTMTSAVIVHTTTVSMNGSSRATMPSRAGWGVLAAECAMAAEPAPASLENAARLKPVDEDSDETSIGGLRARRPRIDDRR